MKSVLLRVVKDIRISKEKSYVFNLITLNQRLYAES